MIKVIVVVIVDRGHDPGVKGLEPQAKKAAGLC